VPTSPKSPAMHKTEFLFASKKFDFFQSGSCFFNFLHPSFIGVRLLKLHFKQFFRHHVSKKNQSIQDTRPREESVQAGLPNFSLIQITDTGKIYQNDHKI
jgi:hypothetical protein